TKEKKTSATPPTHDLSPSLKSRLSSLVCIAAGTLHLLPPRRSTPRTPTTYSRRPTHTSVYPPSVARRPGPLPPPGVASGPAYRRVTPYPPLTTGNHAHLAVPRVLARPSPCSGPSHHADHAAPANLIADPVEGAAGSSRPRPPARHGKRRARGGLLLPADVVVVCAAVLQCDGDPPSRRS
uniref:Uncharacterized protein n=2 Tax=Aegilops tauschii subsp. strangulata TaxID=200361 RepID=A0A453BGI5_AEGTS